MCDLGAIDCSAGTSVCKDTGTANSAANGSTCATNSICNNGQCACAQGASCTPTNVCDVGTIDCSTGAPACNDTGTANPGANGVTCAAGSICDNGQCVSCTPTVSYFASPDAVYNGISTLVTLYTTAHPPADGVTMVPSGTSGPVTSLAIVATTPHVQVVVPAGTPVGTYDIAIEDQTGCPARLPSAIAVVGATTLKLAAAMPPSGWQNANTPVTIVRDTTSSFPPSPVFEPLATAFLTPSGSTGGPAIQLAPAFVDANTLAATISPGLAVGQYDLVVVNPDHTVGVLAKAFTVTSQPPPTIATVAPLAIVGQPGQPLTVTGTNFRAGATLSFESCADPTGTVIGNPATVMTGSLTCTAGGCTLSGILNASILTPGSTCVVRVSNTDGTFALSPAIGITNSSLNIVSPRAGSTMTVARRALVGAAANASSASRFVYAIGGDDGTNVAAPFSSVESAPVDSFGNMNAWTVQRYGLGTGRSFGAGVAVGRYIYACGGTDGGSGGSNALATCQRAMVLDPLETPNLTVGDIEIAPTGLPAGSWLYRVSANIAGVPAELDNPGGETLPSNEVAVKMPLPQNTVAQVTLSWTQPTDSQGNVIPNVIGYNVYRTAMVNGTPGAEVLLATVSGATTLSFVDDGTSAPGTAQPLPLGSTGHWATLPAMLDGRRGLAMTYGFDPSTPSTFYVYAFYGLSGAGTALASYEILPVDVGTNGHQTIPVSWRLGAFTTPAPRWQMGAWRVDATVFPTAGNVVYVGGGLTAAGVGANNVEAGTIGAGGDLGTLAQVTQMKLTAAGFGAAAGLSQLFTFGGRSAAPSSSSTSAALIQPQPGLSVNTWNAGVSLLDPLYLLGIGTQGPFVFLLGGETAAGAPVVVTNHTEILTF
jgi:hypothetical protein